MAQTHGRGDSMTDPAQRAESVKMGFSKLVKNTSKVSWA